MIAQQEPPPVQSDAPEDAHIGRDELNLCEFPLAMISDRVPDGKRTVSYQDRIFDQGKNTLVDRKVTITGTDAHGLPTASDADVLVALLHHTRVTNNFTARRVPFCKYDLMKILRWDNESYFYNRLRESLHRWHGVSIYYDLSWRDKPSKMWTSKMVHVLDNVELNGRLGRRKQGEPLTSWYTWGEVVFASLQAGNLKRLDLDLYFGLRTSTAKFMYRYLDKHFFNKSALRLDLDTLAYEKLGISRNQNIGQVKRRLAPAIQELEEIGFIERLVDRYERIDQGLWKVVFVRKLAHKQEVPLPQTPTMNRLIEYGVSEVSARRLALEYDQASIDRQIQVMLWKRRKNPDSVRDPGGYLVKAIDGKYAVPEEYFAEQKKEEVKAVQATVQVDKAKQKAIQRANDAKVREYWEAMSKDDQEAFLKEAFEAADPEARKNYDELPVRPESLRKAFMATLRDIHIRRKLGIPEPDDD